MAWRSRHPHVLAHKIDRPNDQEPGHTAPAQTDPSSRGRRHCPHVRTLAWFLPWRQTRVWRPYRKRLAPCTSEDRRAELSFPSHIVGTSTWTLQSLYTKHEDSFLPARSMGFCRRLPWWPLAGTCHPNPESPRMPFATRREPRHRVALPACPCLANTRRHPDSNRIGGCATVTTCCKDSVPKIPMEEEGC